LSAPVAQRTLGSPTPARSRAGLVDAGDTVVSGLAAGIDTAAHLGALDRAGRTLAVIGTGLRRAYPATNAPLQQRIADDAAVVSQFWPDAPPSKRTFPMRNVLMSGLARATVVIEASETSGARMQARLAAMASASMERGSRYGALPAHHQAVADRPGGAFVGDDQLQQVRALHVDDRWTRERRQGRRRRPMDTDFA
jgi:DNA processing protein